MFNEIIDECKQLVLELLSFHVLSTWVKHPKLGFFLVLVSGCNSRFFPIHKEILGFLNVALSGLLIFSQVMKKMKNGFYRYGF